MAYCALTDRCEAQGIEAAQFAVDLDRRLGLLDHLAVPLIVFGQIYQCHGDHALAFASYEEALGLAEQVGATFLFPCSTNSLPFILMPGTRCWRRPIWRNHRRCASGPGRARCPFGSAVSLLTRRRKELHMIMTHAQPAVSPGEPAPDFTLSTADGEDLVSLAAYRILDNHSAHILRETRAWLAAQPAGRFEFTFTPKHGSWLNLVKENILQVRPLSPALHPDGIKARTQGTHHDRHR